MNLTDAEYKGLHTIFWLFPSCSPAYTPTRYHTCLYVPGQNSQMDYYQSSSCITKACFQAANFKARTKTIFDDVKTPMLCVADRASVYWLVFLMCDINFYFSHLQLSFMSVVVTHLGCMALILSVCFAKLLISPDIFHILSHYNHKLQWILLVFLWIKINFNLKASNIVSSRI